MNRLVLTTALLFSLFTFAVSAAADDSAVNDPACYSAGSLLAVDAGCPGSNDLLDSTATAALERVVAAAPAHVDDFPPSCHLHAEAVFWTASD
jgi:hypothetical protein